MKVKDLVKVLSYDTRLHIWHTHGVRVCYRDNEKMQPTYCDECQAYYTPEGCDGVPHSIEKEKVVNFEGTANEVPIMLADRHIMDVRIIENYARRGRGGKHVKEESWLSIHIKEAAE